MTITTVAKLDWHTVVPLDQRERIVEHMLEPSYGYGSGELEQLRSRLDQQDKVLRAILHGCSQKNFRHTVQHFGIQLERQT